MSQDQPKEPAIRWNRVYAGILVWLVVMIALMRWLTQTYS